MLDFSSTLKDSSKDKENTIRGSNLDNKSISASVISDTSPVYIFCTSKHGINSKNENGWTPIYRSIIANNLIALNELLNLGSDPNISNNLGETPLYLCVDIDNYDALIILLQYNADTNIAKRNGTTPLHLAAKKNKDNFMHALLRNKANPNLPNKLYSQTATHIAIINKIDEEMLSIFHEYNADIYNMKDKYEKTPFDYAKEFKDEEYVQLLIKIFGDENNEKDSKQSKTMIINKIPEDIKKNKDQILNIPKNLHNSNYNIQPEKICINHYEIHEIENNNNIDDNKEENNNIEDNIKDKIEDKDKENNNNINNIVESDNKSKKYGILNSGDPLYSDRSVSKISESIKSKQDNNIYSYQKYLLEKNNINEFQPMPTSTENEIKSKNSLKNFKNNINIDTKMIDNSKDIILMSNDNNEQEHDHNNFEKEEEDIDIKKGTNGIKDDKCDIEDNENNVNEINELNESNDENKVIIEKITNNDKEIIKNIISSTVKKIKVNSNTYNSEYSSFNNISVNQNNVNNNSNSKNEVLKLVNFSSNHNTNNSHEENKLSINNTNLDKYIETNNQLENGTSSFILFNSKKNENENKSNSIFTQNKISEITPISKVDNQITHTGNSNIFSELQLNTNPNQNEITQNEEEICNKEQNINEKKDNINISNSSNKNIKENEKVKNIQLISNSGDNIIYDGSLEYSKSKSYATELPLPIQSNSNNNLPNLNNNNLFNQHHRQISYHNNKSSINKRKKDNDESNNVSINKENDNPNNNEIIYYNKNYLAGNNSAKSDRNYIDEKNTVVQKNIQTKAHTQSDINNDMNVKKYSSITNKTNSLNQKIYTYTSPNINKVKYLINNNSNKDEKKENNENLNINNLNNAIINTNPNVNLSNLNGTKEDFFSINNNLSSFLNTNKLESKDKQNAFLHESNNNDNSTFNVYDDIVEIKNFNKKVNLYTIDQSNNDNKNLSKNEGKLRNNIRGSSMGNTTFSSIAKNAINTRKQSIYSTIKNNNMNSSNIILTERNSNANNINESNNLIKNIPINMLLRLRDWLISCDLLCYYNLLIENNMYDIDKCINDLQNNNITITYKDIEDIGIRKPGHIFRLLLKLEIDSGILNNNLFNYILSKFNMSSSISNNIILTNSVTEINCCGICNKNRNYNSYIKRNDCPYNDIFSFLKYKDLWKYKENFLHNGFDQLEYVLLQLFSKYNYDKDIMNDCFHIYIENDKLNVLNKLYEEKKSICLECGIENEENEINPIFSNYSYSSKYSAKKKNNNNSENTPKKNNENNCCFIF